MANSYVYKVMQFFPQYLVDKWMIQGVKVDFDEELGIYDLAMINDWEMVNKRNRVVALLLQRLRDQIDLCIQEERFGVDGFGELLKDLSIAAHQAGLKSAQVEDSAWNKIMQSGEKQPLVFIKSIEVTAKNDPFSRQQYSADNYAVVLEQGAKGLKF